MDDAARMADALAQQAVELEARPRQLDAGLWFAEDYHTALAQKGRGLATWALVPGRVPGTAWTRVGRYEFVLRPNQSASHALDAFLAGLTLTECTLWVLALQYTAVRARLGDARFDALFGSTGVVVPLRQRLQLTWAPRNPVDFFFTRFERAPLASLHAGDHLYYGGVPGYLVKHPIGVAQGWNVLCAGHTSAGEPLYIGLGLDRPITATGLRSHLVEAYNLPRHTIERWMARLRPRKFSLAKHGLRDVVEDVPEATLGFTWMRRLRAEAFAELAAGGEPFTTFCANGG